MEIPSLSNPLSATPGLRGRALALFLAFKKGERKEEK
jgi:hypothetical protein